MNLKRIEGNRRGLKGRVHQCRGGRKGGVFTYSTGKKETRRRGAKTVAGSSTEGKRHSRRNPNGQTKKDPKVYEKHRARRRKKVPKKNTKKKAPGWGCARQGATRTEARRGQRKTKLRGTRRQPATNRSKRGIENQRGGGSQKERCCFKNSEEKQDHKKSANRRRARNGSLTHKEGGRKKSDENRKGKGVLTGGVSGVPRGVWQKKGRGRSFQQKIGGHCRRRKNWGSRGGNRRAPSEDRGDVTFSQRWNS